MNNKEEKITENEEIINDSDNTSKVEEIKEDEAEKSKEENDKKEHGEGLDQEKNSEEIFQEEIKLLRDEKLRLLAEMENLRKRGDRDRIDSIRYGSINLARDILSPDDNLTRALEAIPKGEKNSEAVNNLVDGLKMVQKEFSTILEKYGVKKIEALNKKFDHNYHQAVVEIDSDEVETGIVIKEIQSGYIMHDRLLRPAMVGVSKKTQIETNSNENPKDLSNKDD